MKVYRWDRDPELKNLYDAEVGVLSRGLGGDFAVVNLTLPSDSEERLIAIGELRFGKGKQQLVKVEFPTRYPFAPPKIYAINAQLDQNKNLIGIPTPHLFGRGNQYGDGLLCLFRISQWDKNSQNIGWVLRRAQRWLRSATSKEGFKPEEIVEENNAYLPHVGQILLPTKVSIPENANSGEIVLTQFKPNHYILEQNVLGGQPFLLQVGREVFKWYRFNEDMKFNDVFASFNGQILAKAIQTHFGENITEGNPVKNIGLFFPGDLNSWHFFKVLIQALGPVNALQCQYFISRTIDQELYLRTKDIFDHEVLRTKRVTIVGLGAIGSEVAKSLARNGVGHFNVFDNDTFEVGNSVRHAADLFFIGETKVNVAKQLIHRSNPNITVNAYHLDVLNDSGLLEQALENSDLCLVLTAEDSVDYLINDKYTKRFQIPFVFARVSAGGVSGSIQIVDSSSACLRCLSSQSLDLLPKPGKEIEFEELKPEYGSCSAPAVPGSEIDTKEVALQVARVSMQLLLQENETRYPRLLGKQLYWHGPYGSASHEPFAWEFKNYDKDNSCSICQ